MTTVASTAKPAVVLVHGGFVDGSGWEDVYKILKKDGYDVSIVQNPTTSLADDVAVTKRAIAAQKAPVVLVGHSYGGVVITEAGNDPKVAALVYIAAFAPDKGESVNALIKNPLPGAPVPPILPPQDGFLALDKSKFHASFAADLSPEKADFMADSQVPWGLEALNGAVSAAGVAHEAELVPGRDRRQDDPAARSAIDVKARGRHSRRGQRQPCHLRIAGGRSGFVDQEGRQRCEGGRDLKRVERSPPAGSARVCRRRPNADLLLRSLYIFLRARGDPLQQLVQRRAKRLSPRCQPVLDFRWNLMMDDALYDAVGFHLTQLLSQHLL